MALLVLVSTLLRYIAGHPLSFSDELAGLLFLTMAFTTFPHVLNKSGHISLDLVVKKLPYSFQKACVVLAALIFAAFAITFTYQAWQFMAFSKMISSRTDVSGILLWPWMALMPASMILCIVVEVKKLLCPTRTETLQEIQS